MIPFYKGSRGCMFYSTLTCPETRVQIDACVAPEVCLNQRKTTTLAQTKVGDMTIEASERASILVTKHSQSSLVASEASRFFVATLRSGPECHDSTSTSFSSAAPNGPAEFVSSTRSCKKSVPKTLDPRIYHVTYT